MYLAPLIFSVGICSVGTGEWLTTYETGKAIAFGAACDDFIVQSPRAVQGRRNSFLAFFRV